MQLVPNVLVINDGNGNSRLLIPKAKSGGGPKLVGVARDADLADHYDLSGGLLDAGSILVAQSYGINSSLLTTQVALTNTEIVFVMTQVGRYIMCNGLRYLLTTNGNYTGANYNKLGLYSYDPSDGTLTLIANSADNGSWWKGGTGLRTASFNAPYAVTPGVYFMAYLFNGTNITVAPQLAGAASVLTSACSTLDLPQSCKTYSYKGSVTDLPSTIVTTDLTAAVTRPWIGLVQGSTAPS